MLAKLHKYSHRVGAGSYYVGLANTKFNDRVSKLFSDKFCDIGK